jgi:hypothetical protein
MNMIPQFVIKVTGGKTGAEYDDGYSHQEDSFSAKMEECVPPGESSHSVSKRDGTPRTAPTVVQP